MTATYKLEVLIDGDWETVVETKDPFEYGGAVLKQSADQNSLRSSTILDHDQPRERVAQHSDPRIAAALDKFDEDPAADVSVKLSAAPSLAVRSDTTVNAELKPTPQQPSIGRIVHYFQGALNKVVPAIVTEIGEIPKGHQIADVKLHVFWGGGLEDRSQGGWYTFSDEYKSGCWSWPPRG